MRKYTSNLAFVDFLFILLLAFISMFILALILINPVTKQSEVERKYRTLSKGSSWNVKVLGRVIQRIDVAKFKYSQVLRIKTADGKYLSMSDDGSNTKKEDEESEYNLFEIIFMKKHGYNCMAFYNKKTE